MSLSSQVRLSRCALFAICCSISNLKEVEVKTNHIRLGVTTVTVADKIKTPHSARSFQHLPGSFQGPIAKTYTRVYQSWTTVNRQEVLVGVKAGSGASAVTKQRVAAVIAVIISIHFFFTAKELLHWPFKKPPKAYSFQGFQGSSGF